MDFVCGYSEWIKEAEESATHLDSRLKGRQSQLLKISGVQVNVCGKGSIAGESSRPSSAHSTCKSGDASSDGSSKPS